MDLCSVESPQEHTVRLVLSLGHALYAGLASGSKPLIPFGPGATREAASCSELSR